MSSKTYLLVSGVIFLAVALLHLLRLILKWEAVIGGWTVPIWFSVGAVVIALFLSYHGFKYSK